MKKIAIGVIAVAAMVCFSSIFIVDEGQKASCSLAR
jgi:membrane protease subunit HflC